MSIRISNDTLKAMADAGMAMVLVNAYSVRILKPGEEDEEQEE